MAEDAKELAGGLESINSGQNGREVGKQHGKTLFVTHLPYAVTNTDLVTFFSDVGPLRRAFVVTDRETKKSKGLGYVTYTDSEDAERALQQLQGASIDGSRRHIQLEWADRRPSNNDGRSSKTSDDLQSKPHVGPSQAGRRQNLLERDPDAVRTIVVSGLAACNPQADTKTVYKRMRKVGDVEHVEFKELDGSPSSDVALVRFRTPNHAMEAVTKLHAHQFKGAQLSVGLKKRLDGALRLEQHMRPDTLHKQKSLKRKVEEMNQDAWKIGQNPIGLNRESRVIVRNLPFDITMEDLRAIFLPYGPIYDITLPTKPEDSNSESSRGRGFAFVWFVSRSDASRAMESVNGVSLRRGAAEQAALKKAKGKKGRDAAKQALEKAQMSAQPARPVAVDWAISQKDWLSRAEEEQAEIGDSKGTSSKRAHSETESEDDSDEDEASSENESDSETSESDEDSTDQKGDDSAGENDDDRPQNRMADTESGTILFIRNLPYQATEEELKELFRSFGPLRYAKITMDPTTKRSRGTGFVCFWKRESADAALRESDLVQRETAASSLLDSKIARSNPFSAPSVMTADPSAPLVSKFTLHGRVLHVARAVTREHASKLETASRKTREKGDNRNTWLLREGVPLPNTPLSKLLSEKEVDRRLQSFSIRRAQLGANPSLHVSKTRLAVHQLPLFVTDKMLKRMALYALRAFTDEVKRGEREDLDDDEKADKTMSANIKDTDQDPAKKRPPPSLVIQSKVVRQNERVDPMTGKGRSRGYGFLEMRSYTHALKVLRWANGNKGLGELLTTWWKEDLAKQVSALKSEKQLSEEQRLYLKRMDNMLQTLEEEGSKAIKSEVRGTLRIEFSIENVTTVRKRVMRQSEAREKRVKRQKLETRPASSESVPPPERYAAQSRSAQTANPMQENKHQRKSLGSLIGKKRKERKRKHSGA
ncbi:RNA recognition motif-containing protein [Malassezia psittaci]|uniref:RNA recognition motif-containing protein n=1 Tax=Malassezia psittaci TaxID=1821823 RepID=A0AAF0JJ22_9BASI|nr:RNA recognition motif-containing protein [Malassezia psittaci]